MEEKAADFFSALNVVCCARDFGTVFPDFSLFYPIYEYLCMETKLIFTARVWIKKLSCMLWVQ